MKRKKSLIIVFINMIILIIFVPIFLYFKQGGTYRTAQSLLNQYYQLRNTDASGAKQALSVLLKMHPNNEAAARELGDFYLRQGDTYHALKQYIELHRLYPTDQEINLRYARLLLLTGNFKTAKTLLDEAYHKGNSDVRAMAAIAINQNYPANVPHLIGAPQPSAEKPQLALKSILNSSPINHLPSVSVILKPSNKTIVSPTVNMADEATQYLNQYYELKKTDPAAAFILLKKITIDYPNHLVALKEMGYYLISKNEQAAAIPYFKKIYFMTHDPHIALQLAYIYNVLGENMTAYYYFDLATATEDEALRLKAEIAKTNLRDAPTKILPSPFFAEFYYDPFYYSRFKLKVYPVIARFGATANEKYHLEFYTIYRRTSDSASTFTNNVPQIFEDDAAITSVGMRVNPIYNFPMGYFIEYGKAVDLIYQNRGRWRTDFRTGLALYQNWGAPLSYTLHPEWGFKQVGDIYADAVYYSRYNDLIASSRIRQGARVFEYKTFMIDLYMRGFLVLDHDRQFYNNIIEVGPGIAVTPFNRYNFVVRAQMIQGYYLPVHSPSINPYHSPYHNNMIQADFFIRL